MEKAFGRTETNAQFFYDLLQGEAGGFPDESIDGALPDDLPGGPGLGVCKRPAPGDGKIQGSEAITVAFNRLTNFYPKITEHFQQLGLELGAILAPDGSVKPEFVAKVTGQLTGKDNSAPHKSLNYLTAQLFVAEQNQLSPRDPAFAEKLQAFLALPEPTGQAQIQKFLEDPKNAAKLAQWLFRYSEFSILPFKNQVEILKQRGLEESLAKAVLNPLWKDHNLPKLVAQAALLKGLDLEAEAKTLSEDAAKQKGVEARMLFRAAAELDNHNPLARRRLSIYMMREGNLPASSFHLAAAVKDEVGLQYFVEIVRGLEKNDKRLLGTYPDAWSFVAGNLLEAKRYSDAAAVFHEAAKDATARGDQPASLAFTERELLADETGRPYILLFTSDGNPVATALYKALRQQGIPSALFDGHVDSENEAPDRKITATEIFHYLDANWKDERVQRALRAVNFPALPWEAAGEKPAYVTENFQKLDLAGKMVAWHVYEAGELTKKNDPKDAAELEKHLRVASYYQPKNPERHQALGDFYLAQKNYRKAVDAYNVAFAAGGATDMKLKTLLGGAYFGLGEFKNARDCYAMVLEKNPKDSKVLKLRAESNQKYIATLDAAKDADAIKTAQAELDADSAMGMALNAKEQKARLADIEKHLGELHDTDNGSVAVVAALAGIDPDKVETLTKKDLIASVEGLAEQYLSLADQKFADPKDVELVRSELNGLAAESFALLSRFAEADSDADIHRMAKVYDGYRLIAQGKIDEAVAVLTPLRKIPQADKILSKLEKGKQRLVNASALEAWTLYSKNMEQVETDQAKGWLAKAKGVVGKNPVTEVSERWALERSLIAAAKTKLDSGEVDTVEAALQEIAKSGPENLKARANYYTSTEGRAAGDNPVGELIAYVAQKSPAPESAQKILQKTFNLEAKKGAVEASFGIYALIQGVAPEDYIRDRAKTGMDALQGKSGFGRALEKFFVASSPEGLGVDVLMMFAAAGLGNLARLRMLAQLEKAGVVGYKALAIAGATGIGVEVTALWGGNTLKEAMLTDPSKVFTAEHLLKTYGATLLMIGGLKGFGKLGETLGPRAAKGLGLVTEGGAKLSTGGKVLVWGIGHSSGLGGMILTSKANQALGFHPKPVGGWKEGMVQDVYGYIQFAVAHKVADRVFGGKMTQIGQTQHTEIALREATSLARGQIDALGFRATRVEIKVDKEGKVRANGKTLDGMDAKDRAAFEAKLEKSKDGKVKDQVLFLESNDRKILISLFVTAALSRPGFSGGKLTKWIESKQYDKANAYFKEYDLPIRVDESGQLAAATTQESSPHAELGIKPPDGDEETVVTDDMMENTPTPEPKPKAKNIPLDDDSLPFLPDEDVVPIGDPAAETPSQVAARKTGAKRLDVASEPPGAREEAKVPSGKTNFPERLRKSAVFTREGKLLDVTFDKSGRVYLDKQGRVLTNGEHGKSTCTEIQMVALDGNKVGYQLRSVGNEPIQVVGVDGQTREIKVAFQPLQEGDKIRLADKEYTWFGPSTREALQGKYKYAHWFGDKVVLEDAADVQERVQWAEEFSKSREITFVGKEGMFKDIQRVFTDRFTRDPGLSDPKTRAEFEKNFDAMLVALAPVLARVEGKTRSDLAYNLLRQVVDGQINVAGARTLAEGVAEGRFVILPAKPEAAADYHYQLVPTFQGKVVPSEGGLLEGSDAAVPLPFGQTLFQPAQVVGASLQFSTVKGAAGAVHSVANLNPRAELKVFDPVTKEFKKVPPRQRLSLQDGSALLVNGHPFVFRSPEGIVPEIQARSQILAEREALLRKQAQVEALPEGSTDKKLQTEALKKREGVFRDRLKEEGRNEDGVRLDPPALEDPALRTEIFLMARSSTEFAAAARQALAGKLSVSQYQSIQRKIGESLVEAHRAALENVESFLNGFYADPALEKRLSELTDEAGEPVDNPHVRSKDPSDIAPKLGRRGWTDLGPLTDIAGARVVVKTTQDAEAVLAEIESEYPIYNKVAEDGSRELEVIGEELVDGHEVIHVELKIEPDRDHPDRMKVGSSTGYRGRHIVVEVDGHPVEIQVQTESIYKWGKIQHSLVYKNKNLPPENLKAINDFCRDAAQYLTDLENGPDGLVEPALPQLPKEMKPEQRARVEADLQKMVALMDEYAEKALDPGNRVTRVFERPPLPGDNDPTKVYVPRKAPEPSAAAKPGDEPKPAPGGDKAKGKGVLPSRKGAALAVSEPVLDESLGGAPTRSGRRRVPVAKLLGTDGSVLTLPPGKSLVLIGGKKGVSDIVIEGSGLEARHAEIRRGPHGRFELRPVEGREVSYWDGKTWKRIDPQGKGEAHILSPKDRIKLGSWEFAWKPEPRLEVVPMAAPKPPPIPKRKLAEQAFQQHVSRAEGEGIRLIRLVESQDSVLRPEKWQSGFVNSIHPDLSHVPISTSWTGLSEVEFARAQSEGRLKDTAPITYTARILGEQRRSDIETRLSNQYGPRLERVASTDPGQVVWLLRDSKGEAQVRIVLETRALEAPQPAVARSTYQAFVKNYFQEILDWAAASDQRGTYAYRVLEMIGSEGDATGKAMFGTRFTATLQRFETASDPVVRARAGEELSIMCAYLQDMAEVVPEYRLRKEADDLRREALTEKAIHYAWKQGGALRVQSDLAKQADASLTNLGVKLQDLGQRMRRNVPPAERKPGEARYDAYLQAQAELQQAIKTVREMRQTVQKLGVDLDKEYPAPQPAPRTEPEEINADDLIIDEVSDDSRDLHGASDRPNRDMRQFTEVELDNLLTAGLKNVDILRDPTDQHFAQGLVDALDRLLTHPHRSSEYEAAVIRLVGALRHFELFNGKHLPWLGEYLRSYRRDGNGISLETLRPMAQHPANVPLSKLEQKSVGVPELNAHNVMEVISTIRSRSSQLAKVGDFRPFRPGLTDRNVLRKIMLNYGSLVHQTNEKLGTYLDSMFGTQDAYVARLDVDSSKDPGDKLPERRQSGAVQPTQPSPDAQTEPTGAYVEAIPLGGTFGKDLSSLSIPNPTLVGRIPGLTRRLELMFDRGGRVEKWATGGVMLVDAPSGAETRDVRPATPAEISAYMKWSALRGFPRVPEQAAEAGWQALEKRAKDLGISLYLGDDPVEGIPTGAKLSKFLAQNSGQVVYLSQLLDLLPATLLQSGKLKRIFLKTPRQEDAFYGAYDAGDGSVYMYSGGFEGSRRNMAGLFFHEIGHSTAVRYRADAKGDARIPLDIRRDMNEAHDVLVKQGALLGLDWAEGKSHRTRRQAEDFDEFLSDLHIAYVAAGPTLRAHIRSFAEGSPERAAWEFVYSELRDRVFGGLEYDFQAAPTPPSKPTLRVLPGGPAAVKPKLPVTPPPPLSERALNDRMGVDRAEETMQFGGIAAGRHPGKGYSAHNEDRFVVIHFKAPNGKTVTRTWAIDGMGGHEGGEFAAVLTQHVLETVSRRPDVSLEEAIHIADQQMKQHSQFKKLGGEPGAVLVGVEVRELPDSNYEVHFADVGDAEAMILNPTNAYGRLRYQVQGGAYTAKLPGTKRPLPPGHTVQARIQPGAHFVDQALGGHYRLQYGRLDVSKSSHRTTKGSVVVAGSDGLFENFISKNEIGEVLASSGAKTAAEMQLALMNEALIRMWLVTAFSKAKRFGQKITHEDFVAAYQEVWKKAPPPGTWRYEGLVLERGQSGVNIIDPSQDTSADDPSVYIRGHFKRDNVSVVVQIVGEELNPGKSSEPAPDFLPPPLPPQGSYPVATAAPVDGTNSPRH